MDVSLYHRLLGIFVVIAQHCQNRNPPPRWTEMQGVLQQFCIGGNCEAWPPMVPASSLENGFLFLPLLLFYHEDPLYLGDHLKASPLPEVHRPLVEDLGRLLSACLREQVTGETWRNAALASSNFAPEFAHCLNQGQTWRDFMAATRNFAADGDLQQLLIIYGAIAYGRGHWQDSLALVKAEPSMIALWVAIFCGALRGDRHLPLDLESSGNLTEIRQQVIEFWSRWSGLPCSNQLHLDQLPLIANQSALQYRPQLQLISQRHLISPTTTESSFLGK